MKDLLVQKEIDSLWDRVRVMQAWLTDPRVTIVPTDKWKDKEWGELAKGITRPVEVIEKGKTRTYEEADLHNSNLFYKVGLRALPNGRLYLCQPQTEDKKREYMRGIKDARTFENEKLAEIRAIDNERQTQAPPVRTVPTHGGGGMGMG